MGFTLEYVYFIKLLDTTLFLVVTGVTFDKVDKENQT